VAREAYLTWRESFAGRVRRLVPITRRPRLLGAALLLAVLLAFTFAVFPRLALSPEAAQASVVARLEALTGENVSVDGPVSFSLLPRTRLTVERIRIGRGNGFDIDQLVADLDPVDALTGKTRISRLVLIRPELQPESAIADVSWDAAPSQQGIGRARDLLHTFLKRIEGVQILEIRDGVFRPALSSSGGPAGFSNANLRMTQSSGSAAVNVSGSFIWNGQPTDLNFQIAAPEDLLAGKDSTVEFDLQSPPLQASFSGTASLVKNTGISGHLQLTSPSFSRSVDWIGDPEGRVPELGPISVDGHLLLYGRTANLSDAVVSIAGSRGRGALEAKFTPSVPVVGGTLAFAQLDLTPFGRSVAPLPNDPFDMERPIDVAFAEALRLDLRLSAADANLGDVPLSDVAAVVTLGGGVAKIDVGDASVFGGRGQANLVVDGTGATPTVSGDAAFSGIDTAKMFSALGIDDVGMSGQSSITAQLKAPARDWGSIVRNIRFDANIETKGGTLSGFDPQVFAQPGARRLMDGTAGASMPFDSLSAELALRGSRLKLQDIVVVNDSGTLNAEGDYFAGTNTLAIRGDFNANPPQTASIGSGFTSSKPVKFTMRGQWPNPDVTTEAPGEPK